MNNLKNFVILGVCALVSLVSCNSDPYESGDDSVSYLYADFVEAKTGSATQLVGATTDDGTYLSFGQPLSCSWATTPDSIYRALLYYRKKPDVAPEPISIVQVPVLKVKELEEGESMHTDAATLESAWVSAKGKYLNLGIILRTGMDNGLDSKQKIGIVPVGEVEHENGHNVHILRFFHDQNGVPQFYNSRTYGSVNLSQYHAGDTVRLLFNTYSGETVHNFPL